MHWGTLMEIPQEWHVFRRQDETREPGGNPRHGKNICKGLNRGPWNCELAMLLVREMIFPFFLGHTSRSRFWKLTLLHAASHHSPLTKFGLSTLPLCGLGNDGFPTEHQNPDMLEPVSCWNSKRKTLACFPVKLTSCQISLSTRHPVLAKALVKQCSTVTQNYLFTWQATGQSRAWTTGSQSGPQPQIR